MTSVHSWIATAYLERYNYTVGNVGSELQLIVDSADTCFGVISPIYSCLNDATKQLDARRSDET